MLIRAQKVNSLVDFNGTGIFLMSGYLCCACNGVTVKLKCTSNFQESCALLDKIQEAFIRGDKLLTIE